MIWALCMIPQKINELVSSIIATSELVLVSNRNNLSVDEAINEKYVAVDWGISYNIALAKFYPEMNPPILHTTLARTAMEFILSNGGSAYLPYQLIEPYIDDSLFLLEQAPAFQRPIYAAYHMNNTNADNINKIIELISELISSKTDKQAHDLIKV